MICDQQLCITYEQGSCPCIPYKAKRDPACFVYCRGFQQLLLQANKADGMHAAVFLIHLLQTPGCPVRAHSCLNPELSSLDTHD